MIYYHAFVRKMYLHQALLWKTRNFGKIFFLRECAPQTPSTRLHKPIFGPLPPWSFDIHSAAMRMLCVHKSSPCWTGSTPPPWTAGAMAACWWACNAGNKIIIRYKNCHPFRSGKTLASSDHHLYREAGGPEEKFVWFCFVTRRYAWYLNPLLPQRVHIQLEGSIAIDTVLRQSVSLAEGRLYTQGFSFIR